MSADPILNANDCIVVVIYEERLQLAFIRLGKDTTWTYIDETCRPIDDVIYAQDKFYAADGTRGKLLSFDISTSTVVECVAPGVKQNGDFLKKYLVDSDGKRLFMVQRDITYATGKRATTQIQVRELDFDKYWWKRKNTLDGLAIFLGDNSSVSVLASNFPGCQPNCIYFNHDTDRSVRQGRTEGVVDCIVREHRISCLGLRGDVHNDFKEGCRALLLDKDGNPKWEPSRLELVEDDMLEKIFTRKFGENDELKELDVPIRSKL